jgi:hypothetical protein
MFVAFPLVNQCFGSILLSVDAAWSSPLSYQTLLVGFKVANPLLEFFTLLASPIHGLQYRRSVKSAGSRSR